jgi:hypothetical protein
MVSFYTDDKGGAEFNPADAGKLPEVFEKAKGWFEK